MSTTSQQVLNSKDISEPNKNAFLIDQASIQSQDELKNSLEKDNEILMKKSKPKKKKVINVLKNEKNQKVKGKKTKSAQEIGKEMTGCQVFKGIKHNWEHLYFFEWDDICSKNNPLSIWNLKQEVVWFIMNHFYFPKQLLVQNLFQKEVLESLTPVFSLDDKFLKIFGYLVLSKDQGAQKKKNELVNLEEELKVEIGDEKDLKKYVSELQKAFEEFKIKGKKLQSNKQDIVCILQLRNKLIKQLKPLFNDPINEINSLTIKSLLELISTLLMKIKQDSQCKQQLVDVIIREFESVKLQEQFFCRVDEDKKIASTQSVFYEAIPSADILYNIKSYFPIEKNLIDSAEKKIKEEKIERIHDLKIYQPKLRKQNLTHNEMICHVCFSPDYEDDNEIVFCSLCDLSVHQECYNIDKIPKDDWICDPCLEYGIPGKMLSCPLCYCRGGAIFRSNLKTDLQIWKDFNQEYYNNFKGKELTPKFGMVKVKEQLAGKSGIEWYQSYKECYKFTEIELEQQPIDDNVWFHNSCVIWNKRLDRKDKNIKGVDKLLKNKFEQICNICKTKNGYCLKCTNRFCNYQFHIECAKRGNLHFNEFNSNSTIEIYCPEHTPLMVKKNIEKNETKTREQIVKFLKSIKRFIKIHLSITDHAEYEEEQTIQNEPPQNSIEKLDFQELIQFFPQSEKQLFRMVLEQLKQRKDYQFSILLDKNNEEYHLNEIKMPKKFIIKNSIDENALIWKRLQKVYKIKAKNIFNKFQQLKINLLYLYEHQSKYVQEKELIQGCTDEFVPNMDGFDDTKYCICQREWKGETMLECFRCEEWFHPECLNINSKSDTQLNQIDFFCHECEKVFKLDYEGIQIPTKNENHSSFNINKYYLSLPLEQILLKNDLKAIFYDDIQQRKQKKKEKKLKQHKIDKFLIQQEGSNQKSESDKQDSAMTRQESLDLKQFVYQILFEIKTKELSNYYSINLII